MLPLVRRRLDNGLHVVIQRDPWLPLVAVRVRYHVGRIHDPIGLGGLAHLVEHLAFDSLKYVEGGVLRHLHGISAIGINGETRSWSTDYLETVPARDLDTALWLESQRMGCFRKPTAMRLADEVAVLLAENVFHHAGDGLERFEALLRALFPAPDPRGRVPRDEIRAVTVDDVMRFVSTRMAPRNATLVLVGDVPPHVDELVDRHFGPLAGGERPTAPAGLDTPLVGEARIERDDPRPYLQLVWRLPEPSRELDDAVAAVLSWTFDHRAPAEDLPGIAVIEGGTYQEPRGAFGLWLGVESEGDDPWQVLPVVDDALDRIRRAGVPASVLTRTQRRITTRHASSLEPYAERALAIADRLERDPLCDLDAWPRAIESVGCEDLEALAARLGPDRVVLGLRPGGSS
jgi:zinc protease